MKTPAISLDDPIFHDEEAARAHFEALYWPNGPVCKHCGVVNEATKLEGKSHRKGLYQCNACRKPFSVTVGSVMESSHIKLHKWAAAFHLYATSKKGFSAHQLHRNLGITYRSAWFMAHRVREAAGDDEVTPLGGKGKVLEIDETFLGKQPEIFVTGKGWQRKRGTSDMMKVLSLVERGGKARSIKIENLTSEEIAQAISLHVNLGSTLNTDEATYYKPIGRAFKKHETVNHKAGEYARGSAHTNTVEGFFSIFKRGMRGVYQHCGDRHLHRYLKEFDFRYSNRVALGIEDAERAARMMKGAQGKRLTYRQPRSARAV